MRDLGYFRFLIALALAFAWPALAGPRAVDAPVGYHHGYVMDVDYERTHKAEEFSFASPPAQKKKANLKKVIFDQELTKEFKFQYEQQFGRSEVDRNFLNPGRFDEYFYRTGVSVTLEEDLRRKRVFGEYMTKRLFEHHLDRYVKSQPDLRTVYELKDRLSKVSVKTKSGWDIRFRYTLSGNFFETKIKNPWGAKARIFMQMNPQNFGPSEIIETRMNLAFHPVTNVYVNTDYFVEREGGRVSVSRMIMPGLSYSLSYSQFPESRIGNFFQREETLAIFGIAWTQ